MEKVTNKPMSLNFNRIKSEISKAGKSIGEFCLEIDRSDKWLFAAETNNNMKVNDLCAIAYKLNRPIQFFIDNNIEAAGYGQAEVLDELELLRRILKTNQAMLSELERIGK